MNENNNIEAFDDLFKQAFEGAQTPVPPGVWSGISASTGAGAAGSGASGWLAKMLSWKGAAIIGSVALVTTLYIAQTDQTSDNEEINNTELSTSPSKKNQEDSEDGNESFHTNNSTSNPENVNGSENAQPDANGGNIAVTGNPEGQNPDSPIKEFNNQPTNPNLPQSGTGSPDSPQDPKPVKPVENPVADIQLLTSSDQLCVNQSVVVSLQSNVELSGITWKLDGAPLTGNGKQIEVLFTNSGLHRISAEMIALGKRKLVEKRIEVHQTNADFTYKMQPESQSVALSASSNSVSHQWFINNQKIAQGGSLVEVNIAEIKKLEVVHITRNMRGCSDTVVKDVPLRDCNFNPDITDVFTPLGLDGKNDEWIIEMPVVDEYYLVIFAPGGNKVFETHDQNEVWNGKRFNTGDVVSAGSYVYQLVYKCSGKSKPISGKLTVL